MLPEKLKKILEQHRDEIIAEQGEPYYDQLIAGQISPQETARWITRFRTFIRRSHDL
jgi:hypothetical protein